MEIELKTYLCNSHHYQQHHVISTAPSPNECANAGTTTTPFEDLCHCLTSSISSHPLAVLSVTQTFHSKTFFLVFFFYELRVAVFEYYICQKIVFSPSFALSVALSGQLRLQMNSSFRLVLLGVSCLWPRRVSAVSRRPLTTESKCRCRAGS